MGAASARRRAGSHSQRVSSKSPLNLGQRQFHSRNVIHLFLFFRLRVQIEISEMTWGEVRTIGEMRHSFDAFKVEKSRAPEPPCYSHLSRPSVNCLCHQKHEQCEIQESPYVAVKRSQNLPLLFFPNEHKT
jgi:hypothetical protein